MSQSSGPPSWLFSNNTSNTTKAAGTVDDTATGTHKKADKMAKKSSKAASSARAQAPSAPPAALLNLVGSFLNQHSFPKAHRAFQKEIDENGWVSEASKDGDNSLISIFQTWESGQNSKVESEAESDDESSDESSSSSSSSSGSGNVRQSGASLTTSSAVEKYTSATKNLKRKAPVDSSSSETSDSSSAYSDSGSGSGSSSDSDDEPRVKKRKTAKAVATKHEPASSDSDSDDGRMDVDGDSSDESSSHNDSSSDSESGSDSTSDSGSEVAAAAKVALPESDSSSSDSDSDSSSDSDADADSAKVKFKNYAQGAASKDSSDTSVTLDNQSPVPKPRVVEPPLPPNPVIKGGKKQNERFSRIPKNMKVDPRFASNEYVSMDYSRRAHEDLIVTKGKGFTKEKNKKKRGSFRGGLIDITERKAVYFD
ncbi:SRP40, domain containing protein [Metarhizium album ARSEF 1941]|uniref:SRP40, domain containing protein n=1 Tax=Metarhizium album (strain ARSEF 1941) TaxID=1081103 RepID=A0A0B2WPK2_METAS|nr:SRP40, domain containing protein [Metarhizium album ARSEF 1941]KHN95943.1 SRP40, domain containing protein [Metarhizium album ARSEF 1941]